MMGGLEVFLIGFLLFGLGAAMGLSAGRDRYVPPAPVDPRGHVRHVRVGTCRECGAADVEVHRFRAHELLDPDDVCGPCLRVLAGHPKGVIQ